MSPQDIAALCMGVPLKTCANETCGRRFVIPEGGRRTKGVAYCRAACARAQKQRQYRRRKAA